MGHTGAEKPHLGHFYLWCDRHLSQLGHCLTQFDNLTVTCRTHDLDLFSQCSTRLVINFGDLDCSPLSLYMLVFFFPVGIVFFFCKHIKALVVG